MKQEGNSGDIRCRSCGKLLARDEGERVVVQEGKGEVRVYQAVAIGLTCSRCGGRQDMPAGRA